MIHSENRVDVESNKNKSSGRSDNNNNKIHSRRINNPMINQLVNGVGNKRAMQMLKNYDVNQEPVEQNNHDDSTLQRVIIMGSKPISSATRDEAYFQSTFIPNIRRVCTRSKYRMAVDEIMHQVNLMIDEWEEMRFMSYLQLVDTAYDRIPRLPVPMGDAVAAFEPPEWGYEVPAAGAADMDRMKRETSPALEARRSFEMRHSDMEFTIGEYKHRVGGSGRFVTPVGEGTGAVPSDYVSLINGLRRLLIALTDVPDQRAADRIIARVLLDLLTTGLRVTERIPDPTHRAFFVRLYSIIVAAEGIGRSSSNVAIACAGFSHIAHTGEDLLEFMSENMLFVNTEEESGIPGFGGSRMSKAHKVDLRQAEKANAFFQRVGRREHDLLLRFAKSNGIDIRNKEAVIQFVRMNIDMVLRFFEERVAEWQGDPEE